MPLKISNIPQNIEGSLVLRRYGKIVLGFPLWKKAWETLL
jgi:hypothetical protein